MRITIANPVYRLENGRYTCLFPSRWDWSGRQPANFHYYPYELAYLSSLLKREMAGHSVTLVDGNFEKLDWQGLLSRVKDTKPDVFITECSAMTYPSMTKVMKGLDCYTILTGPLGTYNPGKAYEDGWDLVIAGEFEHKVLAYLQDKPMPTGYIDLDWLPWPDDEDISRINYHEISNPISGMVQLYPTRGCPLACTFCVVPMYYGGHGNSHKSHRCRDIHNVCDEIEYLADKYEGQFSGCFFNEETHNADVDWLVSFAEELIRRGLNQYSYDAMCGYWPFTEEIIELLARAGYIYLRVGIESFSKDVGKSIKKVVFPDKFIRFLEWCKKYGVAVYGTSQIGAPGSTAQDDIETFKALLALKQKGLLDRWQHSISTPQPGTPFYNEVKEKGYLVTEQLERFNGVQPVIDWPDYPWEDIAFVKRIYRDNAPVD